FVVWTVPSPSPLRGQVAPTQSLHPAILYTRDRHLTSIGEPKTSPTGDRERSARATACGGPSCEALPEPGCSKLCTRPRRPELGTTGVRVHTPPPRGLACRGLST